MLGRPPKYPKKNFPIRNDAEYRRALTLLGDFYHSPTPDPTDPQYPILLAVWAFEDAQGRPQNCPHGHAFLHLDPNSPGRFKLKRILVEIHSREGARLFYGSAPDPQTGKKRAPSLFTIADKLGAIVDLARAANPFAIFALVVIEDNLFEIKVTIKKLLRDADKLSSAFLAGDAGGTVPETEIIKTALHAQSFSSYGHALSGSVSPVKIKALSFRTAYAFLLTGACCATDYLARKVQALAATGVITSKERHRVVEIAGKDIRRLEHLICVMSSRFKKIPIKKLRIEDLLGKKLGPSRAKAVAEACCLFSGQGIFPQEILTGRRKPAYLVLGDDAAGKAAMSILAEALEQTIPTSTVTSTVKEREALQHA